MKIYSKRAFKVATIFFFLYSFFIVFGSPFLLSWGVEGFFAKITKPFLYFPLDWPSLIVEYSLFFLIFNIIFWSTVVYTFILINERIFSKEKP